MTFLFPFILFAQPQSEEIERTTYRFNYGKFLEEKRQRGERNRKLLEMMDRIDQQAANLATRSEMFKKVKVSAFLFIMNKFLGKLNYLIDGIIILMSCCCVFFSLNWAKCINTKRGKTL